MPTATVTAKLDGSGSDSSSDVFAHSAGAVASGTSVEGPHEMKVGLGSQQQEQQQEFDPHVEEAARQAQYGALARACSAHVLAMMGE